MNKSSLFKKLHELNIEIYHVSSKWFVTDCRLLNKTEKEMIKKVGDVIPAGLEIELTDGSLTTIPYYPSSAPYDGKLRIVSLQKIGEPTITRVSLEMFLKRLPHSQKLRISIELSEKRNRKS